MVFSFLPFSIHVVKGHSMQPSIKEGDGVVVFNWAYLFSRPKAGDIIVFDSNSEKYVKRVAAVAKNKELVVEGDNRNDSRKLPLVKKSAVIGRVVFSYH
ncbi:signal peptidase I [Candidatus Woesearchaeota archaeon]|nr:signal peptidase I [Candidatus Woesearchaeota archaeon]